MMHIQHGINTCHRCYTDRAWRKACGIVGVVWGRVEEHIVVDAFEGKVLHGKLHGRVGLQRHIGLQTVVIHSCYGRLLGKIVCFFVNNAGKGLNLNGGKSQGFCLRLAALRSSFQKTLWLSCIFFSNLRGEMFQYTS